MANKPKLPKKYFDKRPRNFEEFLNQLANTVNDMHDYMVKLDKYIVEKFQDMKDSDLTIQQRLERTRDVNQEVETLKREVNSLREKLNNAIINTEEK